MSMQTIVIGISFLTCLFLAAVLFTLFSKKEFLQTNLLSAPLAFCLSAILGIGSLSLAFWYDNDFVAIMTPRLYLTPLLSLLLIMISFFIKIRGSVEVGTFLASLIAVFGTHSFLMIFPQLPEWINQSLTVLLLWGFALSFRAVSGLNPLPQTEGLTISGGLVLLYLFGLAPFIIGLTCAGLFGIFLIAYVRCPLQPFGPKYISAIGFILGWLGLVSYREYLLPSFLIFSMFFLAEAVICTARKITFLPKYQEFIYNAVTIQSLKEGLSADNLIRVIWNTNILLLLLGLFQTNSPNTYSLPLFAAIITAWQLYRMLHWQTESKTLKETHEEVVKELKTSLKNIFNNDKDNPSDKK